MKKKYSCSRKCITFMLEKIAIVFVKNILNLGPSVAACWLLRFFSVALQVGVVEY